MEVFHNYIKLASPSSNALGVVGGPTISVQTILTGCRQSASLVLITTSNHQTTQTPGEIRLITQRGILSQNLTVSILHKRVNLLGGVNEQKGGSVALSIDVTVGLQQQDGRLRTTSTGNSRLGGIIPASKERNALRQSQSCKFVGSHWDFWEGNAEGTGITCRPNQT
jgi:hypothetical protein